MTTALPIHLLDLRQVSSRSLEDLFREEARHWKEELFWDYRASIELIRKFVDSRALGGYVAMEDGHAAGYGFYVLEDRKGLIGGLFVSSHYPQVEITKQLLDEMLATLLATPRIQRIEAQLMPFGTGLEASHLSTLFRIYPRQFMLLQLEQAQVKNAPLAPGFRVEPWTDRAFEACARLIQLAYADHVDSEINDQYRSESGALKFLRNIVVLPGCGQFLPEASFLVRPGNGEPPVAMVLTSKVADGVGHTTQICVQPGYQKHGLGRHLMECSIRALRSRRYHSLSLTVTSTNTSAVRLYENLGFQGIKNFFAGVWKAQ